MTMLVMSDDTPEMRSALTAPATYLAPQLTAKHLRMWDPVARSTGMPIFHRMEEAETYHGPLLVGPTDGVRAMLRRRSDAGRPWIYWDRGYFARFPNIPDPFGYHRLTINAYQQNWVRHDVLQDRAQAAVRLLKEWPLRSWRKSGRDILLCAPSPTYAAFHGCEGWVCAAIDTMERYTDRPVRIRHKSNGTPLDRDLHDVHAVVAHGGNVAVEAAMLGVPVFVHSSSAAAPIGCTDLSKIEQPITPDRMRWFLSLAYGQFTFTEMLEGIPWSTITPRP